MYVSAHFALTDDQAAAILSGMGAGDLITAHEHGLDATLLPFEYVPAGTFGAGPLGSLLGHVARNNPQWSTPCVGQALVIVGAGDHYVSPSYLPGATEGRTMVPTWDYVTVHAHGTLVAHDDPDWVRGVVTSLTQRHEGARAATYGGTPWAVSDAPADYLERMLRAVVGVELRIERLVAKAKMSQNKTPEDVEHEIAALEAEGLTDLATFKREVSLPAAIRRREVLAEVGRRGPKHP